MSFYTALTGLNGAQADISATSNNIANVGTTGFKRSRAEFGDIFATSPLQNASSSIGSGTILKGIKQQFTQGNIASSLNALDLAISGQGFFALQPSLTSSQTVYTRNGSFNVDNDRYVVDSAGQYLMTYPVNTDGSVTAKDLDSAVPLQLPVTSGDPKATSNIQLGVNVPADAPVITSQDQFADGYAFNPDDASTYTNSTSITIFDDLGNPTIATIYFIKTQTASADDPTNKYDTRLVINDTIIDPNLVSAVDDAGAQIFVDRFGNQTTQVPDDNYFLEGKGSPLYKLDDLKKQVDSEPASITGAQAGFDFGEEGDKLVEIVTDPLMFGATREGGKSDSDIFWGRDFLLVNVDDSDVPVSIDLRPGKYNAEQLAAEVERAINEAYGDDKKIQLYQNVDDKLTLDFFKLNTTDGTSEGLDTAIEIDLLQPSYVTDFSSIDTEGTSPDFTTDEFLTHLQERINQELDTYAYSFDTDGEQVGNASALGVEGRLFASVKGAPISHPLGSVTSPAELAEPQAIAFDIDHTVTKLVADDANALMSVTDTRIRPSDEIGVTPEFEVHTIDLAEQSLSAGEEFTLDIPHPDGPFSLVYTVTSGDTAEDLLNGLKVDQDYDENLFQLSLVSGKLKVSYADDFNVTGQSSLNKAGARETQAIDASNFTPSAGEIYTLVVMDPDGGQVNVELSYTVAAGDTLSDVIDGLSQDNDADNNKFLLSLENNDILVKYQNAGNIVNQSTLKVEGASAEQTIDLSNFALTQGNTITLTLTDPANGENIELNYTVAQNDTVADLHTGLTGHVNYDPTKFTFTLENTEFKISYVSEGAVALAEFSDSGDADNSASGVASIEGTSSSNTITANVLTDGSNDDTFGVTKVDGASGVIDIQKIDASTLLSEMVANETYTLTVGSTKLVYVPTSDSQSIDELLAGFASHPDYDETEFSLSNEGSSLVITQANERTVSQLSTLSRSVGSQLDDVTTARYMTYSYFGDRPELAVYDKKEVLSANSIAYDSSQNTLTIKLPNGLGADDFNSSSIKLIGADATSDLNGRELRVLEVNASGEIKIDTTSLGLPEELSSSVKSAGIELYYNPSQNMEAYFEGSEPTVEGVLNTYDSRRIILREIGASANRRSDTSSNMKSSNLEGNTAISFNIDNDLEAMNAIEVLGLQSYVNNSSDAQIGWVDRRNPPVQVAYDEVNQRLAFSVDRTVLGTGTSSNFNAFTVYSSADADSTNGIGIPTSNNSQEVLIRGGEVLHTGSFIADGDEIQLNDKRYGVTVEYNSDSKNFTFSSGTTGEAISEDGALGVTQNQKASNIQIGRKNILSSGGADPSEVSFGDTQIIGGGSNILMGFDANSNDYLFTGGKGLASESATAVGRAAQSDLTEVFRLNSTNGENVFNVSVNGINGIIDIPAGNYVGTTLATALEQRINQISDPETGNVVGGVKVRYSPTENNFTFTTGTTGSTSTIKVKGTARLGLADVPLGVGSVPKIFNLVQATNADGVALYVDASGNVVTSPPENLVEGYYPLYIDEGELTFDKTGRLVSPRNNVSYEQQAEGFSISLDIDYSASTQFAQPFSVLSVEQDGFTSGRLDGLEIDSSGTIRANYTNGQNTPLGKIVVANFNNQNGLKQIGNATYVETAVSGTPQVGEAGSEGFGNILSGSLERSNVDITEELVNLITAQRNYQASAKAIETTTSLTQTIINIRM